MERIDVAPDGDIILVVRNTLELRVHSLVLNISSPVFKAMLGPNFAEGQIHGTAANPKIVPLPDDEPEGMKLLCLIMYAQIEAPQATPSVQAILQLVKTADKYQCIPQVRLTTEAWLSRFEISYSSDEPGALLHITYLINDAKSFFRLSGSLVDHSHEQYGRRNEHDEVSNKLKDAAQAHANAIRRSLHEGIDDAVNKLCCTMAKQHYLRNPPGLEPPAHKDPDGDEYSMEYNPEQFEYHYDGSIPAKCDYIQRITWMHQVALAGGKIWPRGTRDPWLGNFIAAVQDFEVPPRDPSINFCFDGDVPCIHRESGGEIDDHFRNKMKLVKQEAMSVRFGLCLDCFKAGGEFEGKCRVKHPKKGDTERV